MINLNEFQVTSTEVFCFCHTSPQKLGQSNRSSFFSLWQTREINFYQGSSFAFGLFCLGNFPFFPLAPLSRRFEEAGEKVGGSREILNRTEARDGGGNVQILISHG